MSTLQTARWLPRVYRWFLFLSLLGSVGCTYGMFRAFLVVDPARFWELWLFIALFDGLTLCLSWLVLSIHRLAVLTRLLRESQPLVCWNYSPEQWQRWNQWRKPYVNREDQFRWVIPVLLGAIVGEWIFQWLRMFDIALVVGIFLLLMAAMLLIRLVRRGYVNARFDSPREIVVWPDTLLVDTVLSTWHSPGGRFESLEMAPDSPGMLVLHFTYSLPRKGGRNKHHVLVPVPHGEEDQARWLLGVFSARK
ncbi:MAG TPA: hypothetical protein PLF96_12625 [Thermotogota bacterium]|nr:hypothetical protein [Thermotogota bacterium]